VPHTFPAKVEEIVHNARILSADQVKEAKKRMSALEKRDEDKLKTDEAKNAYESLIYEFRSWLNDDDNAIYVPADERETLIKKCNEAEDWLYEDGSDVGYKVYQEKTYDLKKDYTKFKGRQEAKEKREAAVKKATEQLTTLRDKVSELSEKKPWITESERNDVLDRVNETREWLEGKVAEQEKQRLDEEPVLQANDILARTKKVQALFKKVSTKSKPKKPKAEKDAKTDDKKSEDSKSEEKKESSEEQAKAEDL